MGVEYTVLASGRRRVEVYGRFRDGWERTGIGKPRRHFEWRVLDSAGTTIRDSGLEGEGARYARPEVALRDGLIFATSPFPHASQ